MNRRVIRVFSLVLCILMCATMLPLTALAADEGVFSRPALFAVSNGKPVITAQPKDQSVKQGASVTFQVKASGSDLKFQWYYRKNASSSWTKYSGMTRSKLTFSAGRVNNYQYRCKVTSGSSYVYSKAATLKVNYVKYRALLVGEVAFTWDNATRNQGDVKQIKSMLNAITPPKGGSYAITSKYNLTTEGVQKAIATTFADADDNDVSLFFMATHGAVHIASGADAGYMCTVDKNGNEGVLYMYQLAGWLKEVPGKVIVILGSCGSGAAILKNGAAANVSTDADAFNDAAIQAFAAANEYVPDNSGDVTANTGEFRNSKFYVLTAAKHQESSWGQEGSNPYNYFPYYVAKGGKGAADANKNGKITLNELYNYAYAKAKGPYQEYAGGPKYYQHARVYPSNSTYVLFRH